MQVNAGTSLADQLCIKISIVCGKKAYDVLTSGGNVDPIHNVSFGA